ncbi:MAG: tyrosine recombinase XerC [Clostridia bacterium]|nr:tyrosine recombinase XerC [Clostridia bacterium]
MNTAEKYADHPEITREFLNYKLAIQGCSVKTVEEYALDLKNFLKYYLACKQGKKTDKETLDSISIISVDLETVKNIKTEDIYQYLFFLTESKGNASAAKARKLSSIKGFYKYLVAKRRYFEENPAVNIESPKQKKALPKYLTLEESLNLLDTVKNDKDSKTTARDFAIITLFLNCGMRVSELVGISLNDIDRELRSLRVVGKGNKERIIYLNEACRDALTKYLSVRMGIGAKNNALFLSSREQRISVKTVQWMVYKYLDMSGLESKHYSVHKLRHTAATLMYQSGNVDVRVLKDILGHEQLNTTQIYTHVSNESMEAAMSQNPLAKVNKNKKGES